MNCNLFEANREEEEKREEKEEALSVCVKERKQVKKTIYTVLSAEQMILSEYNHCTIIDELCVQITKYILCVCCTAKDLIYKNCDLNTFVSVFCLLISFLSEHVQRRHIIFL